MPEHGRSPSSSGNARAGAALFYFSGHGLQARGINYLIPKNAQLRSETQLLQEAVPLQHIVQTMEERSKMTLTFLDACRDNPLAEELQRSILGKERSAAVPRGFAPMSIRNPNTLVVFAAAPGKTASDGTGQNSPFTTAMLHHMETAGEDIEIVMKRVTREVHEATGGAQVPERLSRLTSDFSLNPKLNQGWETTEVLRTSKTGKSTPAQMPLSDPCKKENPPVSCLWGAHP
jgi:uncharacterized caspase-like protein